MSFLKYVRAAKILFFYPGFCKRLNTAHTELIVFSVTETISYQLNRSKHFSYFTLLRLLIFAD